MAAVAEQAAKIMAPLAGTATVWGLELGLRLGVFQHLATAGEAQTSDEVAGALGLDPLYTRGIRRSAYAGEVLDLDGDRYRLAEHMDTVLLDEDHPAYFGGA